jgi:hypothetical protein
VPGATSRYLRQAALFEKKERNFPAAVALFADAVRRDPQARARACGLVGVRAYGGVRLRV